MNKFLTDLPVYLTIIVCFICGISDIRTRKIPNIVTFPSILIGLILNTVISFYLGQNWYGLYSSLLGFAIGFGFFLFFYLISQGKKMGAGDVKLFGAIGALLGYKMTVFSLIATAFTGLIIVIILFFPVFYWLIRSANFSLLTTFKNKPVPYGVSIAIGTIIICFLKIFQFINIGLYF